MTDRPLVSIAIPTYDRPDMLRLALRSALEQTYENLDVFVCDDGTNPDTEAVVREEAAGDQRVRFERNERNLGNYGNGLKVLRESRGEYLKMLLDDDLLAPNHVETLLAPMLADPSITLTFSRRTVIDQDGVPQPDPPGIMALAAHPVRIPGHELIQLCTSMFVNIIGEQTTVLYPRAAIDLRAPCRFAGGVPSAVLADLTIWLSLLSRGDAWYTPEPLSMFRQHAGQVSNRPAVRQESMCDWAMLHERMHLAAPPLDRAKRMAAQGKLIASLAVVISEAPDLPQSAVAQEALERATRNFGALREHDRVLDVPRVSIVLVVEGDAPQLMAQLEAIVVHTPDDAFEVVFVTVNPSDEVQQLLGSLEGDVQVLEAPDEERAWRTGVDASNHEYVVFLAAGARPCRGWLAALLDGSSPVDGEDEQPAAIASADGERALLARRADVDDWELGAGPWRCASSVHAQTTCAVDAAE